MSSPTEAEDQSARWNGPSGQAWVEHRAVMDAMLEPFIRPLTEIAVSSGAKRVLDVGCGTGETTRALARAAGPGGLCVGVDISAPMIEEARRLPVSEGAAKTQFLCADAAEHDVGEAAFDLVASRFGVMFFPAPTRAFTRLREAAAPGGRLAFVAWRRPKDTPFMTAAKRAAAPVLPDMPPVDPEAPGQFAFADRGRMEGILAEGGWRDVEIEPIDVPCRVAASARDLFITGIGPLASLLDDLDEGRREDAIARARAALDAFRSGDDLRFVAGCWLVRARA